MEISSQKMDKVEVVVVPYTEEYLACSWGWLNDPEVKALTATPDFTREQQASWYRSLAAKKDYLIWGIEIQGRPAGVFGIKNIENGRGEYWGYIGLKEFWGRGAGTSLMRQAFTLASQAGISMLYLKVLKSNISAAALYKKMLFQIYETDELFTWMERPV